MKAVLQRVLYASVSINSEEISSINKGYFILLGIDKDDEFSECEILSSKVYDLRIFEDDNKKMNLSISDIDGEILVVPNFTICADCRKGKRPSFINAKSPDKAKLLYEKFCDSLRKKNIKKLKTGVFGADMQVNILNDGPVTIILDSKELKRKCWV